MAHPGFDSRIPHQKDFMENKKTCSKCKVESDIENFPLRKHPSGKCYHNSWCKSCRAELERERRAKQRTYKRKKKSEYEVNKPKKIMLTSAKQRAKKNSLPFNITV